MEVGRMKIKKLKVKNFRSLKDIEIEFNEDITCIVGENDAGKREQEKIIELSLHLTNGISLYRKFEKEDNSNIKKEFKCFFLKEDIEKELSKLEARINNENLQEKKLSEIKEDFKEIYEELKDKKNWKVIKIIRLKFII